MSAPFDLTGKYELEQKLGQGGFGAVFKAVQRSTRQVVAVKLLRNIKGDQEAREEFVQRFRREVDLIRQLKSPYTVRLIDAGFYDDAPCMVLEYIDGETLTRRLKSGALGLVETRRVMGQVLEAVAEAHGQGIVHRDLKPENIMLQTSRGRTTAKVLDFGIAGITSDGGSIEVTDTTITKAGQIRGSLHYIAPEQISDFSTPRAQSDVYSLGLILLECLTGDQVITGKDTQELLKKQLCMVINVPGSIYDMGLAEVITRACAKDAGDRYPSANELLDALEEADIPAVTVPGAPPVEVAATPEAPAEADPNATLAVVIKPTVDETTAPAEADSNATLAVVIEETVGEPETSGVDAASVEVTQRDGIAVAAPDASPVEAPAEESPLEVSPLEDTPEPVEAPRAIGTATQPSIWSGPVGVMAAAALVALLVFGGWAIMGGGDDTRASPRSKAPPGGGGTEEQVILPAGMSTKVTAGVVTGATASALAPPVEPAARVDWIAPARRVIMGAVAGLGGLSGASGQTLDATVTTEKPTGNGGKRPRRRTDISTLKPPPKETPPDSPVDPPRRSADDISF